MLLAKKNEFIFLNSRLFLVKTTFFMLDRAQDFEGYPRPTKRDGPHCAASRARDSMPTSMADIIAESGVHSHLRSLQEQERTDPAHRR